MRPVMAIPDPEPTPATGTRMWTFAEPTNCCFVPAVRDAARTEAIRNAALAWYGIPPGTIPTVRWQT